MIALQTAIAFFAASVLLALAPGPDNIFVLTQSAMHGRWAGLCVTLGLCTGLIFHSLAVALGVAVIFQTSEVAFSLLKFAGVSYLLFLAWNAFRAPAEKLRGENGGEVKKWKLYFRGIFMNITNPKVAIFFLAFLPQFCEPSKGPLSTQIMLLGVIFITATILVFGSIALLSGMFGEWLNRSELSQKILNRLAGTVFFGLALKLALEKR